MGSIASYFDLVGQPFSWHVKNICVHGSASYLISRYAGVPYPSHVSLVTAIFYAVVNLARSAVINTAQTRSLGESAVAASKGPSSKKIIGMSDIRVREYQGEREFLENERVVIEVLPFLPHLALTSVMCHGVASRIGLKMPGLFHFLGVLWMNGSISECAIFHLDRCYQSLKGPIAVPEKAPSDNWGPGRQLGSKSHRSSFISLVVLGAALAAFYRVLR